MRSFFSPTSSSTDHRYQVDLPRDVWHTIADFLPDDELINLHSITGAWLYRSIKLRYSLITVEKWEDPVTWRLLNHIKTPFCASFVRRLVIKLVGMKQYNIQGRPGIIPMDMNIPGSPLSFQILKRHTKSSYTYLSSYLPTPRSINPTFDQTMSLLISIIPSLTQIDSLSIDCWDLDPNFDFQPLLTTAWSSFGSNLTTLVFNGNLDSFPHLTTSTPSFPNLKYLELDITINLYNISRDYRRELDSLENHIAPFITSLSTHLESFILFFWPELDLSSFFNRFPTRFEKLKHVGLRMPYNKAYEDPTGLMRFLSPVGSPRLQDLQLRLNPTGAALDRTAEVPLAQFLQTLITTTTDDDGNDNNNDNEENNQAFNSLRSLELFPTHVPEGLTVLYTLISRSFETLNKVGIRDRSLQVEELREVVGVLSGCEKLEILRFNVSRLDVEVVQILAEGLPKLRRLSVFIDESRNVIEPSISPTLEEDLAQRDFSAWALDDIGLWRAGSHVDTGLMQAFARCVPNLKSFWGHGHMDQEQLACAKLQQREGSPSIVSMNVRKLCGCLSAAGFAN